MGVDNFKTISFHHKERRRPSRAAVSAGLVLGALMFVRPSEEEVLPRLQKKKLRFKELPKVPLRGDKATKI